VAGWGDADHSVSDEGTAWPSLWHLQSAVPIRWRVHSFAVTEAGQVLNLGAVVNFKKIHRLWHEEGLRVREHHPRKRAGYPRRRKRHRHI